MSHNRPWNLRDLGLCMIATERQRGNLCFAIIAVLCLLIIAASLSAGDAVAAATAADWAADAAKAAAATGTAVQAADAAGWSWGQLGALAGGVALFCARFVPGVGGAVANVAWQAFADRNARQADQAASAATFAVRLVHDSAPLAVQAALDKLPPDQAAAVRSLLTVKA